jgi:hypothetical protein
MQLSRYKDGLGTLILNFFVIDPFHVQEQNVGAKHLYLLDTEKDFSIFIYFWVENMNSKVKKEISIRKKIRKSRERKSKT